MDPQKHFTASTLQTFPGQRRVLAINEMLNGSPPSRHVPVDEPFPGVPPPPPGRPRSPLLSDWPPHPLGNIPRPHDLHHPWRNHIPALDAPPPGMNPYRDNHDYNVTHAPQPRPGHNANPLTQYPYPPPQIPYYTQPRTLPEPNVAQIHEKATQMVEPPRPRKACMICLEVFWGQDTEDRFPHNCTKCASGNYCATCLKDWFLDACKNESKMPPRCCSIIPLSSVSALLNTSEVELYKAKFEEWSTPDRLYCPVPQCSTFIPPRLFNESIKTGALFRLINREASQSLNPILSDESTASNAPSCAIQSKLMKPAVTCPTCHTSICTKCRSFRHLGECPKSDLDPILEEQLKKWKIKRCPKCRAGVRKMFGCSHIECRCGAHFCWECLLPINVCDGGCDEEGSDADPNEYVYEEDDLDGRAGYHEGDGHEFGAEPYGTILDNWACAHNWFLAPASHGVGTRPVRTGLECHRCFRLAKVEAKDQIETKPRRKDDDTEMTGMPQARWPTNLFGELAWQCFSGHFRCDRCPRFPPMHRAGDETWLWSCDCGIVCPDCNNAKAREIQAKENEMAWECRCGMVICGACKSLEPS